VISGKNPKDPETSAKSPAAKESHSASKERIFRGLSSGGIGDLSGWITPSCRSLQEDLDLLLGGQGGDRLSSIFFAGLIEISPLDLPYGNK
jgi:hypothetical protein